MKKIYLLLLTLLAFTTVAFAQPSVLGTHLVNGAYTTYNLNSIGLFRQYRLQASSSAAISTRIWEFAKGTAAAPDYTTNWRPNTAGNTLTSNIIIPATFANGARYNTALGGASGLLPVITSGNYYTFNVNINSASNNEMELLETTYSPVTISSVIATTPANASNSVLITCTVSPAPSAGENVFVRYSTDGYTTSALSQFTFTGTTGQALLPCQTGGTTVSYYVMSSNQTAVQITTDVGLYGQVANDMATLNLKNNGGPNYTYTQGSGGNFGGIYSVPSSCYATVSAFVTALNGGTITAPVTCYAIGGSVTENATAGGISITATGTVANPIIFQKFGSGSYTIQSNAGLTIGSINDAIFKLIGADYITIDGFTLQENPSNATTGGGTPAILVTGNNMTEFGVALLGASTTDGAQNNTIKNNTISLNIAYTNTFGIYSNCRHTATSVTFVVEITSVTGSNFGNKVYANTISSVNYGVVFNGSGLAGQLDDGNDIGGSSVATGNTFTNWGSAGTALSGYVNLTGSNYCIFVNQQINDNISYNTITGATHTTTNVHGGILKNYTLGQPTGSTFTSTISYNTITLTSSSASGGMTVIQNTGLTTLSTATINITNNTIANCAITGVGNTNGFIGITNSSVPGVLNMNNNIIKGTTSNGTGLFQGVANSGAIVTTLNMNSNQLGVAGSGAVTYSVATTFNFNCIYSTNAAATATVNMNNNSVDGISVVTTGVFNTIINNSANAIAANMNGNQLGTVTGTLITFSGAQSNSFTALNSGAGSSTATTSVQNNDVRGVVHSVAASCDEFYVYNNAANLSTTVANNTFTNMNVNTTGNVYLIYDNSSKTSGQTAIYNLNSIVTGFTKSGVGNTMNGFYSGALAVNGATTNITNNSFTNVSVTGATNFYGIYALDGVSSSSGPTENITGNTVSNITGGSATAMGIYIDYSGGTTCTGNTVSNMTGTGALYGIFQGTNNGQGTHSISSNTVSGLASTGATLKGMSLGSASIPTLNISSNTITVLTSTGNTTGISGIDINAGAIVNVNDNLIHALSGSGTTATGANGISTISGTTVNIYKNKIYDISETGATSSTLVNGIVFTGGTTVTAYNNFICDLKAPGANVQDAIRGISILTTLAGTTYNIYYNSVYINAASSGTDFGTSGILHVTSTTATTARLNLIDNIVTNISTPNGTGVTVAYRRSNATLTNYAATSDYNLFYAGSPSATRLIYYDGINSDPTLAAYKTRVSTRDANSISVLPVFTSATDLHLLANSNCQIDGYGTPVAGIITDIDNQVRDAGAPDMGADEFTTSPVSTTLAAVNVCDTKNVSPTGTTFLGGTCSLIAKVLPLPSGGPAVSGKIKTCVWIDGSQQTFNAEPYVQRHFDIEPATANTSTTSAAITLYFTDAEFVAFNTNNPTWPKLPTAAGGGSTDPKTANLKVTQYHGTATTSPSSPGLYNAAAGTGIYIDPLDANIIWNGSYWAVTFNVTGFSGFYVHTNARFALPVTVNYLRGSRQGGAHLLDWKVTCNTTPRATLSLERSADARNFSGIYSITADALRCQQPFDYTDAQPLQGMNYYRLKITDADGKITYSNTIALLNAARGFDIMNIAPNPVTGGTFKLNATAAVSTKMELVISDMTGRVMSRQMVLLSDGYNSIDINVSNLATGTYNIYGSAADDRSGVIRFVKE